MNKPSAIALFVAAAFLAGATSELIPDKKQKNPGRAAAAGASAKQDQAHDVHELEKISLTISHVGASGPGKYHFLRPVPGDISGDGKADSIVVRVICENGAVKDADFWSWGATNTAAAQHSTAAAGHGRAAPGAPTEWIPASPQLRSLSVSYLSKKLHRSSGADMNSDGGGWTKVTLSGADGLCPAIDAVQATKSRSNIQNN